MESAQLDKAEEEATGSGHYRNLLSNQDGPGQKAFVDGKYTIIFTDREGNTRELSPEEMSFVMSARFTSAVLPSLESGTHDYGIESESALGSRQPWEWRKQEEPDIDHYVDRQNELIDDRLESGREQYGTGHPKSLFKGWPIKHLKQEAGDILHYAEWTERELLAKTAMLDRATDIIHRLMVLIPEKGPVTTAYNIRRELGMDVRSYLDDMNRMAYLDQESQYQWVATGSANDAQSGSDTGQEAGD